MWGIVPAAGRGTRIQPLAFSKELLPVGSCCEGGSERPCAVSEYLLERLVMGGVDKICFVISPDKSDIIAYYGTAYGTTPLFYAVQPQPKGLCDSVFRVAPLIHPNESVIIGLPDTIWFPSGALSVLPDSELSFLLFPVDHPECFDAVVQNEDGSVHAIQVKQTNATSNWIWGAFKMPGWIFSTLYALWLERACEDEYFGTLMNAYLACGGRAVGIKAGQAYVDVGTLQGYRRAMNLLAVQHEIAGDGDGMFARNGFGLSEDIPHRSALNLRMPMPRT